MWGVLSPTFALPARIGDQTGVTSFPVLDFTGGVSLIFVAADVEDLDNRLLLHAILYIYQML